ncbi:MAG: DUF3631 domain-containing protein [Coriobacteriia bacterium]|nr:DUF3631 domain-containing protein [Coriobacteriia bacterium]
MSILRLLDGDATEVLPPDGVSVLGDLHAALGRFVAFPSPEAHDAVTAWIVATHAQPAWDHAPRLAIVSPEKRCGKSRLLDVIEATCHAPLISVNVSPAALVRSITDDDPPTLLVDESDTIFGTRRSAENNEDIRGILNAGHQRNRPYIRWDMKARQREDCPTFAMAALASIGDLPDTIMDRSVIVRMRRRAPGEVVAPYRARRDAPGLHAIRERLGAWAARHVDELADHRPTMPVEDRAADTWEPLIAIADVAGGVWPERIRAACLYLVGANDAEAADASLGVRLLTDLCDVFAERRADFIPSRELADALCAIGEAPWDDFNLSMHGLARRLQVYGIRPRQNTERSARGYHERDFADAWSRYIPSATVQVSEQASDQGEQGGQLPLDGVSAQVSAHAPGQLSGQLPKAQVSDDFRRSDTLLDASDSLDSYPT